MGDFNYTVWAETHDTLRGDEGSPNGSGIIDYARDEGHLMLNALGFDSGGSKSHRVTKHLVLSFGCRRSRWRAPRWLVCRQRGRGRASS